MLWRVLAWSVLLPPFAVVLLLFTERGSQLVLDNVGRLAPIEIEHSGGTLAGTLELQRLVWRSEGLELELQGVVLELIPSCLWYSKVCFQQLQARELELAVLPSPPEGSDAVADDDDTLVVFPFPLETEHLQVDALRVHWQGGEWRQGQITASVQIYGSTIDIRKAEVANAKLTLQGSPDTSSEPVILPEINLPLELLVGELTIASAGWDLSGALGQVDQLGLRGAWLRQELQVQELRIAAEEFGSWVARGSLEFAGPWPLAVTLDGEMPTLDAWPSLLDRTLALKASGDLTALLITASMGGSVDVAADASLAPLDPELPFRLSARGNWPGTLALTALTDLPESLASLELTAPLQISASGSLQEQAFQLEGVAAGFGYESVAVRLAGTHRQGLLHIEDLRLQEANRANTIWARGELDYSGQLSWFATLESSGIDLLPLSEYGASRIEGKLLIDGNLDGESWGIFLSETNIKGTVNGLPARIKGYTGIDSQLRLAPSELHAEINDTRLLLEVAQDRASPARLEVVLDDLGLWLKGSGGKLSLQASAAPDWQDFNVRGSLLDIHWQDMGSKSAKLTGAYRAGSDAAFDLALELVDLTAAGLEFSSAKLIAGGDVHRQSLSIQTLGDVAGQLTVAGKRGAAGTWSGRLEPTTLQTEQGNWHLGEAVAIQYFPEPDRIRLSAHCWQFQQTRLCPGDSLLGEAGSTSLALDSDLASLAAFLPQGFTLSGSVTGQFGASWTPQRALLIDGDIEAGNVLLTRRNAEGEAGSVEWKKIAAQLRSGVQGLAIEASIFNEDTRMVELDLQLPADRAGVLSGKLDIRSLQLATYAPLLPTLAVLEGEVSGSLQVMGTGERPLVEGVLGLSAGEVGLVGNPTELEQLELVVTAAGDRALIRGSGLLGGGPLEINGNVLTEPDWQLNVALEGDNHEILLPPYTRMQVSETLDLAATGRLLDITGKVVVHEGELEHEQLPEGGVTLSDDVVEVDLTGNIIHESSPLDISMDIDLLIANKFKIVGDMVNATLGGELQLVQAPRQPLQVFGNLNLIGGELRAYQQRLRIQRGTISFAGTPDNPELDMRAQREITSDKVVVGLQLQGTLKQSKLEVYSEPHMSHGEAMSYLVRGRGLDSGAGSDGMAMALSLGTGLVNQSAIVSELNSIPGISNLAFGAEGTTEEDTAATVGGYIGDRLYLSYGMGIYEPINVLTARLYLQTRLWLEVVSRLENSVDLYYSFDIE